MAMDGCSTESLVFISYVDDILRNEHRILPYKKKKKPRCRCQIEIWGFTVVLFLYFSAGSVQS